MIPSSYYERQPINDPFMHSKPPMASIGYPDSYVSHDPLPSLRAPQLNVIQRISYLVFQSAGFFWDEILDYH